VLRTMLMCSTLPELEKGIDALGTGDILVVAATRSMIDGIHLIERINDRGALSKVLDKAALGSHHAAQSRLHRLPIGNGRAKKSSADHVVISSPSQTTLETSISCITPNKNGLLERRRRRAVCREAG
jgi:hypothetical protein